jgi:hypothetical protein
VNCAWAAIDQKTIELTSASHCANCPKRFMFPLFPRRCGSGFPQKEDIAPTPAPGILSECRIRLVDFL